MNIPEKMKLNGVTYDIIWRDDLYDDNEKLDGRIHFDNNTIELNKSNQSYQSACRTLLHELVHFILREHSLNVNEVEIPTDEEELCELFSRGFYQIFEDNKLY